MLDFITYGSITLIVTIIVLSLESSVKRIERKINRVDFYVGLILDRLEIDVPSPLPTRIREIALDPQRKIEAIKLYREATGAGLREAKEAIETFIDMNRNTNK